MNAARNPWNVKTPGSELWKGQEATDAAGTAVFTGPEYGARACFINLQSYYVAGYNTLRKIVQRATPPDDHIGGRANEPMNDTEGYTKSLVERLGMDPDDTIPNPRQHPYWAVRFMREVSRLEGSGFDWPPLLRGAALWCEDRPL
jgi:hypothetical protein